MTPPSRASIRCCRFANVATNGRERVALSVVDVLATFGGDDRNDVLALAEVRQVLAAPVGGRVLVTPRAATTKRFVTEDAAVHPLTSLKVATRAQTGLPVAASGVGTAAQGPRIRADFRRANGYFVSHAATSAAQSGSSENSPRRIPICAPVCVIHPVSPILGGTEGRPVERVCTSSRGCGPVLRARMKASSAPGSNAWPGVSDFVRRLVQSWRSVILISSFVV
jgi:hypothetical protein